VIAAREWPDAARLEVVADWLLEHARDERDEHMWVRIVGGAVRDVALGCSWAPRGRQWRRLGSTDELLGAGPEVLAERIAAAQEPRGAATT
jgi:tRNA nucleotidyltransferase/poly(A) polymerase